MEHTGTQNLKCKPRYPSSWKQVVHAIVNKCQRGSPALMTAFIASYSALVYTGRSTIRSFHSWLGFGGWLEVSSRVNATVLKTSRDWCSLLTHCHSEWHHSVIIIVGHKSFKMNFFPRWICQCVQNWPISRCLESSFCQVCPLFYVLYIFEY